MIDDLHPLAYVILAALAWCVPPVIVYLLMDKSDDPRPSRRNQ